VEVVASLSQGRTAAAQCGLFTHKSVPVIFEPPCTSTFFQGPGMKHDYRQFRHLNCNTVLNFVVNFSNLKIYQAVN